MGDVVVAVMDRDPKPRPAVLIAWRGDRAVLAPLTTNNRNHAPYLPSWVRCDPGRFIEPGHVWRGGMQVIDADVIAPVRIGRAGPELAELLLDVHWAWDLTLAEVEQFRWACEE